MVEVSETIVRRALVKLAVPAGWTDEQVRRRLDAVYEEVLDDVRHSHLWRIDTDAGTSGPHELLGAAVHEPDVVFSVDDEDKEEDTDGDG
jgi:hypothetical protein